ncbi:MAG: outer membrane protein assembly factor BamB family protein [Blastococcus sp.]
MPRQLRRPPLRVWLWAAATAVLLVVATLLWRGSDAAATESTTAAPAGVPSGTPAAAVSEAWSAPGSVPDDVVANGRVLIGSAHGVRALDPATGREAWHYTRSNARMCGLTATNGVAVAVFATAQRCDEMVALDAATGVRSWTRNVNFRADATLVSTDRIVLAISPTGLVTLDPTGDNIRWRYKAPAGCHILDAATGSSGVALLQQCPGAPAVQLRLLDGFAGSAHWSRDLTAPEDASFRLLGADQLLGVAEGRDVHLFAGTDGTDLRTLPGAASGTVRQRAVGSTALLWAGGTLTALDDTSAGTRWQAPAAGLPAAPEVSATAKYLLVPDAAGFTHRDAATGKELGRSAVAGVPAGGVAGRVGPTVVYRLPDRVLAYR